MSPEGRGISCRYQCLRFNSTLLGLENEVAGANSWTWRARASYRDLLDFAERDGVAGSVVELSCPGACEPSAEFGQIGPMI